VHEQGNTSMCVNLSALKFGPDAINPAQDYVEGKNYLVLFAKGTAVGVGAEAMAFIDPKATSTNKDVSAPDACASKVLAFSAHLSTQTVKMPASGPWVVDWSKATKDSTGNLIQAGSIDQVLVAFYAGKTPSDLE
jgi:hypothetical protein